MISPFKKLALGQNKSRFQRALLSSPPRFWKFSRLNHIVVCTLGTTRYTALVIDGTAGTMTPEGISLRKHDPGITAGPILSTHPVPDRGHFFPVQSNPPPAKSRPLVEEVSWRRWTTSRWNSHPARTGLENIRGIRHLNVGLRSRGAWDGNRSTRTPSQPCAVAPESPVALSLGESDPPGRDTSVIMPRNS